MDDDDDYVMDPDAALEEMRKLAKVTDTRALDSWEQDRFADLLTGLDEFLSKGGHLPRAWKR